MTGKARKTVTRQCNFTNSQGNTLDARLDLPSEIEDTNQLTYIIFCHCFTCSKETITTFRLSRLLAEQGYGILRFDFTGLGDSEGDFAETTFNTMQDDLRSAIDFLSRHYQSPIFLMGHSLGGTTALSIAQDYPFIKGVVTVASPSEPDHVLHHFGHALTLLEQNISASFEVAGLFYDIEPGFVEDVRRINMQDKLARMDKPVLIFDIENDALVGSSNAEEIHQWTEGEVTLVELKDTDHLLSSRESTQLVAGRITQWMRSITNR